MRVAVILTARASWAKLEPVCRALKSRGADVQIIACASALLERYGRVVDVVKAQGYEVAAEVWSVYEGSNLVTSAKETGALLGELASVVHRLRPDTAVVCADRHEVLAAAQAVVYQHVPLVHLQGGERSGSIDDRARDSITQLSDLHCVATERAKYRVYSLTGQIDSVFNTGCPSIDLAKQAVSEPSVTTQELGGAGHPIDLAHGFIVWLQHPVTSEPHADEQMAITGDALDDLDTQILALWPGQDAGAEAMSKVLRRYQERVHTVRNLEPVRFLKLLTQAQCLVGNSSAGIREASYLGVPVVNIGSRQQGRERAKNVVDVPHEVQAIRLATRCQMAHGPYPSVGLYGRGDAGEQIARVIVGQRARLNPCA